MCFYECESVTLFGVLVLCVIILLFVCVICLDPGAEDSQEAG